jgi:hypothetical protein
MLNLTAAEVKTWPISAYRNAQIFRSILNEDDQIPERLTAGAAVLTVAGSMRFVRRLVIWLIY